jgi:hypothetical protein
MTLRQTYIEKHQSETLNGPLNDKPMTYVKSDFISNLNYC